MFDPEKLPLLRQRIREETLATTHLLDEVVTEVKSLEMGTVTIQPKNTNMMSLVASDAGNNSIEFNPLQLQLVRVVDTYGRELFFDVVSSETNTIDLSLRQFDESGAPRTPLGVLMADLGVETLHQLSPMIPEKPDSGNWTLVYRDLCEWAVIYEQCHKEFLSSTILLHDGLLRTKIFAGDLFIQMYKKIKLAIDKARKESKREIFLVGIAKHTQVLERYRMAMALSGIFSPGSPQYAEIPMELQKKVYKWSEYVRLPNENSAEGEDPKYNMGRMYFVRFGPHAGDPIWTVDLLDGQTSSAQFVFGSLLNDAQAGFPIPYYPQCLQLADKHAQIVDLDLAILQDEMVEAVRAHLSKQKQPLFDAHRLSIVDPSARRYT